MDKHRYFREVDTGIIEIQRLLDCLIKNKYEFHGTHDKYGYPDDAIAEFVKPLQFSDKDGNWINDGSLKVSIQFEKRADYTHFERDESEDNIYIGDSEEFITGLIRKIEKTHRKKRRSRKTIKNSNRPASI